MVAAVIAVFVIGYLAIVFEHPLKLDKTVPALIMAAVAWGLIALGHPEIHTSLYSVAAGKDMPHIFPAGDAHGTGHALLHHIGKIAEILVFLIGAMTIIELMDMHKAFTVITNQIKTRNKKSLFVILTWITFFLSAVLDNLTCTIVMVSLIKKLLTDRDEKLYFSAIIIIAANAGGAWSPIGDVTTTMLWNNDQVTSLGLVTTLLLPSIVCTLIPMFLMMRVPCLQGELPAKAEGEGVLSAQGQATAKIMLIVGISALIFVPIFKTVTHLSPYVGMMLALGVVWLVSERVSPEKETDFVSKGRASDTRLNNVMDELGESKAKPAEAHGHGGHGGASQLNAKHALSKIDVSSILFFLGILLTVAGLESLGVLGAFAAMLDGVFPMGDPAAFASGRDIIMVLLGYGSAIVDNVPLVAAAQGMYTTVPIDDKMWHMLAFTAGTGGSMLVIGSAAGVAAMGMENIDFMWYFRKISFVCMLGFLAGVAVFLATYPFIDGIFQLGGQ